MHIFHVLENAIEGMGEGSSRGREGGREKGEKTFLSYMLGSSVWPCCVIKKNPQVSPCEGGDSPSSCFPTSNHLKY